MHVVGFSIEIDYCLLYTAVLVWYLFNVGCVADVSEMLTISSCAMRQMQCPIASAVTCNTNVAVGTMSLKGRLL